MLRLLIKNNDKIYTRFKYDLPVTKRLLQRWVYSPLIHFKLTINRILEKHCWRLFIYFLEMYAKYKELLIDTPLSATKIGINSKLDENWFPVRFQEPMHAISHFAVKYHCYRWKIVYIQHVFLLNITLPSYNLEPYRINVICSFISLYNFRMIS